MKRNGHATLTRHLLPAGLSALVLPLLLGAVPPDDEWDQQKEKYLQASRQEWNYNAGDWREVAAWSFEDGKMPEAFHVFEGEWVVADGALRAVAGKPDGNRRIKIADCQWPAFRLAFDATLEARDGASPDGICDIGIGLNADPETGSFARGYAFITAQYYNQSTVFYRLNVPYARTEWSPIVAGRRHHLMLEVVKPHLRFWVDGRVVLEGWERLGRNVHDHGDFMDMDPGGVITLQTYDTVMTVDNLRILVPASP